MSDVLLEDADGKVIGEGAFSLTGRAVAGVGDVDGDGSPDVMVGAPDHDGPDTSVQGVAYLILGPVAGAVDVADAHATLVGEATGNYAGRSLSGAGDINLDGFDDLWIGSMDREAYRGWPGAGYLVLGPVTGSVDLETVVTKFIGAGDDYAGWSVAGVGDTNGDGLPDLFIGLPANSEFGTYAGAAALILGGGPAFDGTWGP